MPPSVFWSQTVRVTSPAPLTSFETGPAYVAAPLLDPPGAQAVSARATAKAAPIAAVVFVEVLLMGSPRWKPG
jgi:hypothetical protein